MLFQSAREEEQTMYLTNLQYFAGGWITCIMAKYRGEVYQLYIRKDTKFCFDKL